MVKSLPLKNRKLETEHRWYRHTEQTKEGALKNVSQLAGKANLCTTGKHTSNSLQCDQENRLLWIPVTFCTVCYLTVLSTVKIIYVVSVIEERAGH